MFQKQDRTGMISNSNILQSQSMYNHREPTYYENTPFNPDPSYSNPNNLFYARQGQNFRNSSPDEQPIFRRHDDPELTPQHSMEGHYLPRNQWHQSQPTNPVQFSNYNQPSPHEMYSPNVGHRVHQSEYNMQPRVDNGSQYNANPFNNYEDQRAHSVQQMNLGHPGYSPYQDQINVGSTGMPPHEMMGRPQSKRSLYGAPNNFLGSGDAHSVRSLQQNIFLNRYEDDCLYMNLEEEYLHKVSKRMGKSANVSINRSMYNFK